MKNDDIQPEDLCAYIDGRFPADRLAKMEKYLASNTEARQFVATGQAQNRMLRGSLEPVLAEPIPTALLQAATGQENSRWLGFSKIAAVLMVGFFSGFFGNDFLQQQTSSDELLDKVGLAYQIYATDDVRPVEVWADNSPEMMTWLSSRLETRIEIPAFSSLGFRLVGGRLMMGTEKPAALLVFEDDSRRRLAFYIRSDMPIGRGVDLDTQQRRGIRMAAWQRENNGYALSGPLSADEMAQAAVLAKASYS